MIYNTGWANLKPQKLKYTHAIAARAAKLLQSGESLTATALAVKVSRTSLRNWRDRDPKLNAAFTTFEARGGLFGVFSSPAIGSDGTVYVGSLDKKLYAIKTDSKGLAKSPWPMRGQNARHTGRTK